MDMKDTPIFTKVSSDILFLIRQVANAQGLTISEYVRFLILADLQRRGAIDQTITTEALSKLLCEKELRA